MSTLLDSLCSATRLAEIALNEEAMDIVSLYDGFSVSELGGLAPGVVDMENGDE